ncbi:PulJ/GspJ family protein [Pseudidiomarina insulisalsae]|uniref:Prepilin-type cleavage/methylation domain-containing protein n=1 Tax=Pseudidiomarina insulisalsae TaxID=575789 RepID=A0A432YNS2_9GAMM|nr:prepilin-type N-terminal cleavage/methylation domain-containing protein [Pseudidiomarina insulisalsae]RUO62600.1 hypothetical protein CWI71_03985 [Pseudidiomarina insulisalsae]
MGRNHATSGFTLVETLIAMVLLSLLMISGALAYDYFSQNWQRNKGLADVTLERHHLLTLVQKVSWNTYAKTVAMGNERYGFYFLGRDDGFTAVSQISVQHPDLPAVYRIFREPNGRNGYRLVYEEAVLRDTYLTNADQQLPFNFRRILYDNIEQLSFDYYGYQSLTERNATVAGDMGETFQLEWFSEYDGLQRSLHPQAVAINLNGFRWLIEVPDTVEQAMSGYNTDV